MATVDDIPLEQSKPIKRYLNSMKGWIIIFVIFGIIAFFGNILNYFAYFGIIFVLIAIWQWWYETQYYKRYFYDIQSDFLQIKKGVITPKDALFPYEKLQDVYVDQDILDRIFSLWDVHVSTATPMSMMEAHIDGVNEQNANKLREMILGRIKAAKKG